MVTSKEPKGDSQGERLLDGGRQLEGGRLLAEGVPVEGGTSEGVSASSAFALIADTAADNGQGLDVHARHSWEAVFAKVGWCDTNTLTHP